MPKLTDELTPINAVRAPDIMDGPHTWRLTEQGFLRPLGGW